MAKRICIIGYSSSGKSTLADRLARELGISAVHLDQLHFLPGGNWRPRPWEDFVRLHDEAIAGEAWVMEGAYSKTMPQRFARADMIVHIRMNRFGCLYRFVRRYFRAAAGQEDRKGAPAELQENFNWGMVWWIVEPRIFNRNRRKKDRARAALLYQHREKVIEVRSFAEMDALVKKLAGA